MHHKYIDRNQHTHTYITYMDASTHRCTHTNRDISHDNINACMRANTQARIPTYAASQQKLTHIHARTHTTYMQICIHKSINTRMLTHVHACIHASHACMHARMHPCMHTRTRAHMTHHATQLKHLHKHAHIRAYIHTC